jgi:oxaloacetate decarboxylase alpha subunit/pyruvate carboxylase subunit B
MTKQILIRDLTLRDGQQSQFATRMNQKQVEKVLPFFKEANFYAMEVWGGAVPDSIMRYLSENPWYRLESIKKEIKTSKLTALSRGRNLFGYNPYPEEVIEGFNKNAIKSGVDIMRIFDALNDINNMKSTIKYVKENGGQTDCAVCYTADPKFTFLDKLKAIFSGKKIPGPIFTIDYFVNKAKELEKLGADIITIKDMAGLIDTATASKLVKALKKEIKIPIDLHTHCTPGYGLGSVLMAMVNGVDIVDTVIMPFAGGPAAPAFELIQIFADKLGIKTNVNLEAVAKIRKELFEIRKELEDFDQYKLFPKDFDPLKDKLPKEIEKLFDEAIIAAKQDNADIVTKTTQEIEKYFNFPAPNEIVREAQIPGGMYTNMLSQLQTANLSHLLNKVLKTVPRVRLDAGIPPLVTPTSQIVGIQAVNCVVNLNNNKEFYANTSVQFVNLVKGGYGKTPFPVEPLFREKITGSKKEIPYDTSNYKKQNNPVLEEFGGKKLAKDEKEELLLELFPAVAKGFLKNLRKQEFIEEYTKEKIKEQEIIDKNQKELINGLNGNYCYFEDN